MCLKTFFDYKCVCLICFLFCGIFFTTQFSESITVKRRFRDSWNRYAVGLLQKVEELTKISKDKYWVQILKFWNTIPCAKTTYNFFLATTIVIDWKIPNTNKFLQNCTKMSDEMSKTIFFWNLNRKFAIITFLNSHFT